MRRLEVLELGRRRYGPVWELQKRMVEARRSERSPDRLLLVEHEPVYTLGRSADSAHILLSPAQLERRGIDVVRIERGGDVTYHGPGQLVGYPIIRLPGGGKRAAWYVEGLEAVLIAVLAAYGVEAARSSVNRGVWVGDRKIAALGVRIRHGVTMHGFALNVSVDLNAYRGIIPCGIPDRGVASLSEWVPDIEVSDVTASVVESFGKVFEYDDIFYGDAAGPYER